MSRLATDILVIGDDPFAIALASFAARGGHAVTVLADDAAISTGRLSLRLTGQIGDAEVELKLAARQQLRAQATTADLIVVATTLHAHRAITSKLAAAGATAGVLLAPGGVGGALSFARGVPSARFVADVSGFPFLAERRDQHTLRVRAVKHGLAVGVLPLDRRDAAMSAVRAVLADAGESVSVLETSITNTNVLIHPPLVLVNWSRIEAGESFRFYREGLSPGGVRLIESIDAERLAIGKTFGLEQPPLLDIMLHMYADQGMRGASLAEALGSFEPFAETPAPRSATHRYVTDDVPFGLVPLAALGRLAGVPTPSIDATIHALTSLSGIDLTREGRSLEEMGLAGLSRAAVIERLGIPARATR
jgi:opine dehydrogenase